MTAKRARRFLLIDGHVRDRDGIARLLEGAFDTVLTVADTPEAYARALAQGPVDCVLTEHDLSWTEGRQVLRDVQVLWPGVPVIMVTGSDSQRVAVEGFRAGLDDYVRKDQIQDELLPAIRRAIESQPSEQALRASDGQPAYLKGIVEDITERREAEAERERAAERLREALGRAEEGAQMLKALMDYVPEGITMADASLNLIRVSRYGQELLGIAHEGMPVRDVTDEWPVYYPDGITPMAAEDTPLVRAIQHGEIVQDMEIVQLDAHGDPVPLLCNAGPIRDAGGAITGGIVAWRDISERKRAAEALRESRQRLDWMLENTGVGVWLNGLPFGALNWDEQTKKLFFVGPDVEPAIDVFWSRMHPDDVEPTRLAVEQALRDGTLYAIDHRVVNPDTGEIRWIRSKGQAKYAEDGTPTSFDGINYDITESKQSAEDLRTYAAGLEAANQANRVLLQEINHRVKNNLTAILGLIFVERNRLSKEMGQQTGRKETGQQTGSKEMGQQIGSKEMGQQTGSKETGQQTGPGPDELPRCQMALDDLGDRVRSLATVHGLLSANEWSPLRVDELVHAVIWATIHALPEQRPVAVDVTGAQVIVTPEQAHHLALVVSELTTNALKHGCRADGVHIRVDIASAHGEVRLEYRNSGPEYPAAVLTGEGHSVGLGLVEKLARHSLRGGWTLRNDGGPVTEIRFPADGEANRRRVDGRTA